MTTTEMNKASKTALITYIAQLQASEQQTKADLNNAIQIANYFSSVIVDIEKLLLDSPFINKEGKFFKSLFWVISNMDLIKSTIQGIIAAIKEWRNRVQGLVDQQKAATQNTEAQPN